MRKMFLATGSVLALSSCTVGYQRGRGGVGDAPGGLRVGPEGAPIVAVAPGEKPKIIDRGTLRPISKHDDHKHVGCEHPQRVVNGNTLFFYENRWEAEIDGAWVEALGVPAPAAHPNAPR